MIDSIPEINSEKLKQLISVVEHALVDTYRCESYGPQILAAEGLENSSEVQFLSILCGWRLTPDDPQETYHAIWKTLTHRHLNVDHLQAVEEVVAGIQDVELRSRLSDIVWIGKRNHICGRKAANGYFESALRLLQQKEEAYACDRFLRAIQIAAQLDRRGPLFNALTANLVELVSTQRLGHSALCECLELLIEHRCGDPSKLREIATTRAEQLRNNEEHRLFELRFWKIASMFARMAKNENDARLDLIEEAKAMERHATAADRAFQKTHLFQSALHLYRQIPNTEADRDRVHAAMLQSQKAMASELFPVDVGEIDLTTIVEDSFQLIRGKCKEEAFARLVLSPIIPRLSDLRDQVRKAMKAYPLQFLFSTSKMGSTGKIAAAIPSAGHDFEDIPPESLTYNLCEQFGYSVPVAVHGRIEPMRHEFNIAHRLTAGDLRNVFRYSPTVPPDRVEFFVIGVLAGWEGRFIESLHVLIPQLENLLRFQLNLRGVITSSLNSDGVQDEKNLTQLLALPETEDFLGESTCFGLKVIFTEKSGYNLRNELCHGMLTPTAFMSEISIFAWWLILYIAASPMAENIMKHIESKKTN